MISFSLQTAVPCFFFVQMALVYALRNINFFPGELCEHLPMFLLQKLTVISPLIDLFGIRSFRHSMKDMVLWYAYISYIGFPLPIAIVLIKNFLHINRRAKFETFERRLPKRLQLENCFRRANIVMVNTVTDIN